MSSLTALQNLKLRVFSQNYILVCLFLELTWKKLFMLTKVAKEFRCVVYVCTENINHYNSFKKYFTKKL